MLIDNAYPRMNADDSPRPHFVHYDSDVFDPESQAVANEDRGKNKKVSHRIWLKKFREDLFGNLKAGVTVSLVNIPLSISLAIAGGSTPVVGIITAFWSGLFAAIFGGSDFNIVGPTGALSGILSQAAHESGSNALPFLAIMTGIVAFVIWALKLAQYLMFVPSSVVHGFTFGVALIIALNQLDAATGMIVKHEGKEFLSKTIESILSLNKADVGSSVFFVTNTILLLYLAHKWRKIPWAIIFSILGIVIGYLSKNGTITFFNPRTLEDEFGSMTLNVFSFVKWDPAMLNFKMFEKSLDIVFIALLETLISARMADNMVKERGIEHSQQREVFGLAIANIIGGVFGGMPATAALARTVLNVKSDARSRYAAVFGTLSLLILSYFFFNFFQYIPMPTIAALLTMVSARMIDFGEIKHLIKYDRRGFCIFLFTVLICCVSDTMNGLLFGSIISLLIFAKNMSVGSCEMQIMNDRQLVAFVDIKKLDKDGDEKESSLPSMMKLLYNGFDSKYGGPSEHEERLPLISPDSTLPLLRNSTDFDWGDDKNVLIFRISGQLSYINGAKHVRRVKKILQYQANIKHVIISLRTLHHIDLDGLDALQEMIDIFKENDTTLRVVGLINESVAKKLKLLKGVEFDDPILNHLME